VSAALDLGIEKVEAGRASRRADFITLHTPLYRTDAQHPQPDNLAKTRWACASSIGARGGLIDEAALEERLESGHVAGAR
jgi:D-3-phosphoglycerate dehydrogenase